MPVISVIVPVYKVEQYINRCVDSILNQTFSDFELILVDDGSPDNCGKICDEYAEKDKRVVVIHQENGGLSAARNAGIDWAFANSDSEWISFIDSDDWVDPTYLEILYNSAVSNCCEISVCEYTETNGEDVIVIKEENLVDIATPEELYCKNRVLAIIAWAKLYKKELFLDVRYPVGKIHEDEYVTYLLLFKQAKIAVSNKKLYFYYVNNNGITKSSWTVKHLDAVQAIANQIEFFTKYNFSSAVLTSIIEFIQLYSNCSVRLNENKSIYTREINFLNECFERNVIQNEVFWKKLVKIENLKLLANIIESLRRKGIKNKHTKKLFKKFKLAVKRLDAIKESNYLYSVMYPFGFKLNKKVIKRVKQKLHSKK